MAQAIIYICTALIACGLGLWLARRLIITSDKEGDWDGMAVGWLSRIVCVVILICVVSTNAMTITKICVAPRVYLIEYVVSQIHGK
jgi:uncharacterized membrane protein SpoIIM required for sporulation